MKNSVIINFFVSLCSWIAACYNNSGIEKGIDKICKFFVGHAQNSVLVDWFQNRFMSGAFWRESLVFRIVMVPVRVLKFFGRILGDRADQMRKSSTVLGFFNNIFNVPLWQYGVLLLCGLIGYTGCGVFLHRLGRLDLYLSCAVAVFGVFLLFVKCSLSGLASGSVLVKWIQKLFTCYNLSGFGTETKLYHIKPLPIFAVFMVVVGACVGYFHTVAVLLSVAGAIGILLILWKTEIGVFLVVFLAPIMPTMALVALTGVTVVSFVLRLATNKHAEYVVTPFQMMIVAFLALLVLSGLTSVNIMGSVPIVLVYGMFTLSYMLIVNTIKTRTSWNALVVLFVLSGALVALVGVYQNFAGVSTTQSWVDAQMFEDIKVRVYGTFDNPNVLGQYLIFLIPIGFAMLIQKKGANSKAIYGLIQVLMFACLLYTWSRGAWVGVLLALGFFILLRDRRWLILCIIGLLLMPSVLPASILERITSIGNLQDSSTAYRVSVWTASLRIAKDYWMSGIGIGPAAFERIYPAYALNGAGFALHAHNFYIQWVVEMGVLGLLVFLTLIGTSYKQIALVRKGSSMVRVITLAMAGGLLGFMFQGMAENLWYNYRMVLMFWIYLGVLQSGVNIANEKDRVVL